MLKSDRNHTKTLKKHKNVKKSKQKKKSSNKVDILNLTGSKDLVIESHKRNDERLIKYILLNNDFTNINLDDKDKIMKIMIDINDGLLDKRICAFKNLISIINDTENVCRNYGNLIIRQLSMKLEDVMPAIRKKISDVIVCLIKKQNAILSVTNEKVPFLSLTILWQNLKLILNHINNSVRQDGIRLLGALINFLPRFYINEKFVSKMMPTIITLLSNNIKLVATHKTDKKMLITYFNPSSIFNDLIKTFLVILYNFLDTESHNNEVYTFEDFTNNLANSNMSLSNLQNKSTKIFDQEKKKKKINSAFEINITNKSLNQHLVSLCDNMLVCSSLSYQTDVDLATKFLSISCLILKFLIGLCHLSSIKNSDSLNRIKTFLPNNRYGKLMLKIFNQDLLSTDSFSNDLFRLLGLATTVKNLLKKINELDNLPKMIPKQLSQLIYYLYIFCGVVDTNYQENFIKLVKTAYQDIFEIQKLNEGEKISQSIYSLQTELDLIFGKFFDQNIYSVNLMKSKTYSISNLNFLLTMWGLSDDQNNASTEKVLSKSTINKHNRFALLSTD